MMGQMFTDLGIRCETHVGEAFPPRCPDCDQLTIAAASQHVANRLGFIPGSECPNHPNYPLPCAACERIENS